MQWTIDGIPVNGSNYSSSQIVIDGPTSTYNNTLTVTGRAPGMYTCFITTTCSPVCGAAGFNPSPRYITSSLTVLGKYYMCKEYHLLMDVCLFSIQLLLNPPTGVIAKRSGPTAVSVSWTAPISGSPVTRYDISTVWLIESLAQLGVHHFDILCPNQPSSWSSLQHLCHSCGH